MQYINIIGEEQCVYKQMDLSLAIYCTVDNNDVLIQTRVGVSIINPDAERTVTEQ
jgi:hypothetical protein